MFHGVYVMLSRISNSKGLYILADLSILDLLKGKPSMSIIQEKKIGA
jgi:hypothetical protein